MSFGYFLGMLALFAAGNALLTGMWLSFPLYHALTLVFAPLYNGGMLMLFWLSLRPHEELGSPSYQARMRRRLDRQSLREQRRQDRAHRTA